MSDGFVWERNVLPAMIAAFPEKVKGALKKTAFDILADAQTRAPVDTGNLRNSGSASEEGEFTWKVAFSAEYAVYVEMGTRYMTAQPYLIPAWVAGRYKLMTALSRLSLV